MAGKDSGTHLSVLKRDKRRVATLLKYDFSRSSGQQQLEDILGYYLDMERFIDEEMVEWCRYLISGGAEFSEYASKVKQYDSAQVCGLVWTANFIAYRCRTCGISPCMSLCPDCFYGADHTGHDFNMFRSHAGGACDCGDISVMKPSGFCTKHGKKPVTTTVVPPDLTNVAKIVIPRLIIRLLYYLRSKHAEWASNNSLEEGDHLIALLHDLTGLGAVMRTLISQALIDVTMYDTEFKNPTTATTASNQHAYKRMCSEEFEKAKTHGMPPPQPTFYRVRICSDDSGRPHSMCTYQCMRSALDDMRLDDDLDHNTCLEEILFWTVKYEFPENITTWVLGLLPDEGFKDVFIKSFVDHYTRISTILASCSGVEQRSRVSNKVVHVSVQLFSNEIYAIKMSSERQLLTRMVISLYNMLSTNLTQSNMLTSRHNTHQVLDCGREVIKDHCFWPLINDLTSIMSHKPVSLMFMENSTLLDVWFELVSFLQGMNLNERELSQHVEYETDAYYASFSAEFEISCSPLWRLLLHCKDDTTNLPLAFVLKKSIAALNVWFDSIGLSSSRRRINEYQVSFHVPLHRYFAAFLCTAVHHKGFSLTSELELDFIKKVLIHPLQIQVAFYEIFANMWVRNGMQIRGQAMTYTQCHFCNSLIDLDLFLLQVCGCLLDPDYFVRTVISAFHLDHINLPVESSYLPDFTEPKQQAAMLSGCLTLISMLLSIRTYSGQSSEEILHKEIVTLLAFGDKTYSQLGESIPEKSGTNNPPTDLKSHLADVADFKAPGFNVSGKLNQGTYCPKPEVWLNEFDPLHAMLRTVHRREYQQSMDRYAEFVHMANKDMVGKAPWPPFRIPNKPDEPYSGLYNLLRCKSLLHFIFNIIFKVLEKSTSKSRAESNSLHEAPLDLTVFLLTMIVTQNDETTIMFQKELSELDRWFPEKHLFDNLAHVIDTVLIRVPVGHDEKVNVIDDEGEDNADPTSSLNSLMRTGSGRLGPPQLSHAGLPIPRPRDRVPTYTTEISISRGVPVQDSVPTQEVTVPIKESIISLLIKLHNALSEKKGSYVPFKMREDMLDPKDVIGGGPFFVGRVLDLLSTRSEKCSRTIEQVYQELLPKHDQADSSTDVKHRAAEKAKRKAMKRMQKMQNNFGKEVLQTMSKEEFDRITESEPIEEYQVIEHYECAICASTTPSTEEHPLGMVALLQPTCVLNYARIDAQPDKLPLKNVDDGLVPDNLYGSYYQRTTDVLNKLFPNKNAEQDMIGAARDAGLFVQSCGHYIHLDCFDAFSESFSTTSRSRQVLTEAEYYCPMCRQLANTWLPIMPTGSDTPLQIVVPSSRLLCVQNLAKMFTKPTKPLADEDSMASIERVVKDMRENLAPEHRSKLQADNQLIRANFLTSIMRCNVDYALLYHNNNIVIPSRKNCLGHLLTTLSQPIKLHCVQAQDCIDLLGQLTGISLEQVDNTSVTLHQGRVPLLNRDPQLLLIQLLLNTQNYLPQGYLDILISVLYNLAYVQALIHLTCKFNHDERESWLTRVPSAHVGGRRRAARDVKPSLLQAIIQRLTGVKFYPADDSSTQFLELCVWSPQSVESFIQQQCLPLLEFAALLKRDLYGTAFPERAEPYGRRNALPQSGDSSLWFIKLIQHLNLLPTDVDPESLESPSGAALSWVNGDPHSVVNSWLSSSWMVIRKEKETLRNLITNIPVWHMPRLLELPAQYDTIFQHYRLRMCPQCNQTPAAPSVCLVCGSFVCFKEVCCPSQGGVEHAKNCGSGTCVILDINASIVAIIRGKRATLWGSLYLDEHGEEDRDLKRGKPLYLCKDRFRMLEEQWLSHNFDYVCKRWIFHSAQL